MRTITTVSKIQQTHFTATETLLAKRPSTRLSGRLLCAIFHSKASVFRWPKPSIKYHNTDSARLDARLLPLLVQLHKTVPDHNQNLNATQVVFRRLLKVKYVPFLKVPVH